MYMYSVDLNSYYDGHIYSCITIRDPKLWALWCAIDSIIQKNGRWLFTALGQFFSMADTTPLSVKPAKGLLPYEVRIARAALG